MTLNPNMVFTPLCVICATPEGNPKQCEFLSNQRDGAKCESFTHSTNPMKCCGYCAYYKTPKCNFSGEEGYIKKMDVGCVDFFIDRHLTHRTKKPRLVLRPHGKR